MTVMQVLNMHGQQYKSNAISDIPKRLMSRDVWPYILATILSRLSTSTTKPKPKAAYLSSTMCQE